MRTTVIATGLLFVLAASSASPAQQPRSKQPAGNAGARPRAQNARAARESRAGGGAQAGKPNIIFILADDFSRNLLQYMPNVQALEKEGVTFENYFVASSLCCPSRSSIFTGQFPHNTKVFTNNPPDGGFEGFNTNGDSARIFPLALQRAGYRTAMFGKYLNGYEPRKLGPRDGWNDWNVAGEGYKNFDYDLNENGRIKHYGNDEASYLTDVVSGLAQAFIRKSAGGPFFVEVATFAPHFPYTAAYRDTTKFPGLKVPRTAAYAARPDATAPRWLKSIPALTPQEERAIDVDFRKRAQAVQAIDKMIGDIRALLTSLGVQQKTYIVFSSDNGLHMGDYSLRPGKMTPFEIDIHVPLIVFGPGVPAGKTLNEIVENIDLAPSFADLAGQSAPLTPDGHSFVTLLHGSGEDGADGQWRRSALIEHHGPHPENTADPDAPVKYSANPPSYEAIRSETAMYVEYADGDKAYYDLRSDPFELKNTVASLPPGQAKRWHDALRASATCAGAVACWQAQRMMP